MNATRAKIGAVLEVVLVRFGLIWLVLWGRYQVPGLVAWETDRLGFPFLTQAILAGVPLLLLVLARRDLARYGLVFRPAGYHLKVTAIGLLPFLAAGIPLGLGVDYRTWSGALIMAAVQVALLFLLAWLLRKQPTAPALAGGFLLLASGLAGPAEGSIAAALAAFIYYTLFVGFGEEILYRGYVQSRLNEAFGRPYRFFQVPVGWGLPIAALIFGLSHVGILVYLSGWTDQVTWAWGLWTFFGGIVFGFVREKTGSILAPALLHGLPQAIATALMAL